MDHRCGLAHPSFHVNYLGGVLQKPDSVETLIPFYIDLPREIRVAHVSSFIASLDGDFHRLSPCHLLILGLEVDRAIVLPLPGSPSDQSGGISRIALDLEQIGVFICVLASEVSNKGSDQRCLWVDNWIANGGRLVEGYW